MISLLCHVHRPASNDTTNTSSSGRRPMPIVRPS
jgi:hypothetical protein